MRTFISPEGAEELRSVRVGPVPGPTGGRAPVALLARLPSEDCGCPEEFWKVDGVLYLIHMEEDGTAEIHVMNGDEEHALYFVNLKGMDSLRAQMFSFHAQMTCR